MTKTSCWVCGDRQCTKARWAYSEGDNTRVLAAFAACDLPLCQTCKTLALDNTTRTREEDMPGLIRVGGFCWVDDAENLVGATVYKPYEPGRTGLELMYRLAALPSSLDTTEFVERAGFLAVTWR